MIYVSMTGIANKEFNRADSFPLVIGEAGPLDNIGVHVENNKLVVGPDNGQNLLDVTGNKEDMVGLAKVRKNFTVAECNDPGVPTFMILCKGIRFFEKIRTYIRYIRIDNEYMLVSLIYGACEFESGDGTFVPLQRLNSSSLDDKKVTYFSTQDMYRNTVMSKNEVDRSFNCVNAVAVVCGMDGGSSISFRTYIEECTPIDEKDLSEKITAHENELRERRLKMENEKKAALERKEKWLKSMEERRKAEAIAAAEAEAEKAEKAERRRSGTRKSSGKEISGTTKGGYSAGAAAFLAALNKG